MIIIFKSVLADMRLYGWAWDRGNIISILKTISYRIISTISISMIAFIYTGSLLAGVSIGVSELVVNSILYYFHERAWLKLGGNK